MFCFFDHGKGTVPVGADIVAHEFILVVGICQSRELRTRGLYFNYRMKSD